MIKIDCKEGNTVIIDIAIGGIIYVFLSLIFNKNFDIWILGFSIFFALFPDGDFALFTGWRILCTLLRRKFDLIHHKLTHWPLIIIPVPALFVYFLTKDYYLTLICLTALTCHFIHDSFWPDPGPQWLFPFSGNHYCLKESKIISHTRAEFLEIVYEARGKRNLGFFEEIIQELKLNPKISFALIVVSYELNVNLWIWTVLLN